MDVLVASHLYPSSLSRIAGSFVHNQTRFLAAGCRVRVVAPVPWFPLPGFGRWSAYRRLPRHEEMDGVDVARPSYVTFPRRFRFEHVWRSYRRALERTAGPTPDVIHAHCVYPDGLAAVDYGAQRRRPVVITVHGEDLKHLPHGKPSWRAAVEQALAGASAVIAVSGELARCATELGVEAERLEQVPNGVDCDLFRPGTRKPGDGGWRLVYTGRYDPAKGIGELLQALAGLRREGRDVWLDLIGGSAATNLADFRQRAVELGVADRVRFVDELPWAEIPGRLAQADVFVLPSYSEGLPLSLLEALACGLPVVTTRCGGPEEVVGEQVGRLAPPRDAEALQAALAAVLDNYGIYDRDFIRRYAQESFDYRTVAARIHSIYERVSSASVSR